MSMSTNFMFMEISWVSEAETRERYALRRGEEERERQSDDNNVGESHVTDQNS